MLTINSIFDKVVCVNLVDANNKKADMIRRFKEQQIDAEFYTATKFGFANRIVTALNHTKLGRFNEGMVNEFGATISHYSVIKTAFEQGINRLFVFEDDARFRKDFAAVFNTYLSNIPEDWNMILGYSYMQHAITPDIRINPYWIKSAKSWSLLAYGMDRTAMEHYIKSQDSRCCIADSISYLMTAENGIHCYVATPSLFIPDCTTGSSIRSIMNYQIVPTTTNSGFSEANYEK